MQEDGLLSATLHACVVAHSHKFAGCHTSGCATTQALTEGFTTIEALGRLVRPLTRERGQTRTPLPHVTMHAMRTARAMLILGSLALCLAGCEKPLFPKDAPRTPYERYQALRGQQRSATEQNAFGGEEPALRERLRPLGEP